MSMVLLRLHIEFIVIILLIFNFKLIINYFLVNSIEFNIKEAISIFEMFIVTNLTIII